MLDCYILLTEVCVPTHSVGTRYKGLPLHFSLLVTIRGNERDEKTIKEKHEIFIIDNHLMHSHPVC